MPYVHAPDGAMIPGSLCEGDGDTTVRAGDVDCPDCLDVLDAEPFNWHQLASSTAELRGHANYLIETGRIYQ